MYTSFDKINDRFGFSTGGTFKCAYKNTRTYLTAGIITILVIVALIIISLVYVFIQMQKAPSAASAQLGALIGNFLSGRGFSGDAVAGSTMVNLGFGIVGIGFGVLLLTIAVIAFLIVMASMRMGQVYKFKADEQHFTVIFPPKMNQTITFDYNYIIGLNYEEWRFMFAPRCLDVTIYTKQGEFMFRCIHTPMSKANGITETPFNIIRERIGLANEDEAVLINIEASKEHKPNFFG